MPGRKQLVLTLIAVATMALAVPEASADFDDPAAESPDVTTYYPAFSDVPPGHVFESAIRSLFVSGITEGCDIDSTEFCPDDTVTRGQMAAFLTRALDLPQSPSTDFTDDDQNVFENAIQRLAAAQITQGCNPPDNDRYCPNEPVTRGQMAAFLTRALDLPQGPSTDFTDDDQSVFENAIQRLAAAQITRGCNPPDNDRYCPDKPVTRGQMAAFLTRALSLPSPPALPSGVVLERGQSAGTGRGTKLTVCRDSSQSVIVRSATSGDLTVGSARLWEPTHFELTAGEVDFSTDRWFLPAGDGCQTLDVAWDPRSNILAPPLDTLEVVSPFGPRRHPILGGVRLHEGSDFKADTGDPVYAGAPGVVVYADARGGYGNLVDIQHVGGLNTRYAHLSAIDVSVGDLVVTGEVLGAIGCTGLCTAPHLHFETREFDVAVEPMTYLEETPPEEPG